MLNCLCTRYIFSLYLYMVFLTHNHTKFSRRTKKSTWKAKHFKSILETTERRETPLLGLGPRYFFYHYPGHWIPTSVSITQGDATALSYPQFHSNRSLWNVFTVPLKWPMTMQTRVPRWPVVINNSLNRHWSTAFVSIELEIPPVTLNITIDINASLEWDSERCV